jgi:glyoxylase-like metal-dependent hydrolase (beta-lactamase superfamily II)
MTSPADPAAAAWDAEYAAGRYASEQPVAFTSDILAAASQAGPARGLYIGCGNGRNYLPLVDGGLDLTGLDISGAAIAQLNARAPDRHDRLVHGGLSDLPAETTYPLVIGIQVFQHGDRATAHAHIRAAQQRRTPGGLFCLRVNATATDVWPRHEVTERHSDGGFTIQYLAGPKQGLLIHFFSSTEVNELFAGGYTPVLPLRLQGAGLLLNIIAELGRDRAELHRIVLTPRAPDHVQGAPALRERTGARILIHAAGAGWLSGGQVPASGRSGAGPALRPAPLRPAAGYRSHPDATLEDGELIAGSGGLRVIHTPGHSPGNMALPHESTRTVLAGDAVFHTRQARLRATHLPRRSRRSRRRRRADPADITAVGLLCWVRRLVDGPPREMGAGPTRLRAQTAPPHCLLPAAGLPYRRPFPARRALG